MIRADPDPIRDADPEIIRRYGVTSTKFEEIYAQNAPWVIGVPQPEVVDLEGSGELVGDILDVGCGTGDNAMFLAEKGHAVLAIDFVERVVQRARERAAGRGLRVDFAVADALKLADLGRKFDTILDSATFHTFSDEQRLAYPASLAAAAAPHASFRLICFSDRETRPGGPRRTTVGDIARLFVREWELISVRPVRYQASFFADGARAWSAKLRLR